MMIVTMEEAGMAFILNGDGESNIAISTLKALSRSILSCN